MGAVLGESSPFALAVAISPIPITAVILMRSVPKTIYRFESRLFFPNAYTFKSEITHLADHGARRVVPDTEAITDVDTTGAQALREPPTRYANAASPRLSRAPGLRRLVARYGLTGLTYYDSNEAAATAYQESDHG